MNYYEHHIGDYAAATAHLSLVEDAIYSRMLRRYYLTEAPLPVGKESVARLVGARTPEELAAVDAVLFEFFTLADDGWHQKRCDADIAKYHERMAGSDDRRASEAERQRRHRERRAELFAELRERGVTLPFDTATSELVTHLSRVTGGGHNADTTATHTPNTNHQTPKEKAKGQAGRPAFVLPEWLSPDAWQDWHGYRNSRKGWTPKARELSLRTLTELWATGHDPRAVIHQSIERGWTGLFPVRANAPPTASGKPSAAADFRGKTYEATPDDQLPPHLRAAAERALRDD
jgi:uncharacterized protein YdaU (DUF1376 family)